MRPTGILLRFVSCGLISLALGLVWRLTLAPKRIGVGSALLGIVLLLSGFVAGGVLWYIRDARLRLRDPSRVDDERIIFSFVVFVLMPFVVLAVVGMVWLVALIIGGT
jgi:nitrate reductase NapE component